MLFSNDQIARQMNGAFEPVWVSLRPAPLVRIDFGNGKAVTRTLHGNVATYVCTTEGKVLDVMPGIYEPGAYLNGLNEFFLLHRWFIQTGENPEAKIKRYHQSQAAALAKGEPPLTIGFSVPPADPKRRRIPDVTKTIRIEGPLKFVLKPAGKPTRFANTPRLESPSGRSPELLRTLVEDTRVNESTRRRVIHEHLAKQGLIDPDRMTKWLFREVLHADLDDPYFGLGDMLFATYPFRDEDESR